MQSPASHYLAQSHIEDLQRAAAARALRAEARCAASDRHSPRPVSRELVIRSSFVRRMVARLAV